MCMTVYVSNLEPTNFVLEAESYYLSRLVHDAHRIELKGESLRISRKRTSEIPLILLTENIN